MHVAIYKMQIQQKKEVTEQNNAKHELQERIRRAVRMEHRRQNVENEVNSYKARRKFKEEQACFQLRRNDLIL